MRVRLLAYPDDPHRFNAVAFLPSAAPLSCDSVVGGTRIALGTHELVGLIVGLAIAFLLFTFGDAGEMGRAPLLAVGAFAGGLLILRGPLTCFTLLVAFEFLGYRQALVSWRGIDLQITDFLYVLTIGACIVWGRAAPGVLPKGSDPISAFRSLVPVLLVTAMGVLRAGQREPDFFETSLISWMRFAQTLTVAWFVPRIVVSEQALTRVLRASEIGGLIAVLAALGDSALRGNPLGVSSRVQGLGDPNTLGLLGGYLLARGFFQRDASLPWRFFIGTVGALGLVGTRSVSSILATGAACVFGWLIERQPQIPIALRRVVLSLAAIGFSFAVIVVLRPEVTPSARVFWWSSAAERLVVGVAGLRLFWSNPIVGVGWQASTKGQLAAPENMRPLKDHFRLANPAFFAPRRVTTHNAYIQVLAELGIIGFAAFALVFVRVGSRIRALVHRVRGAPLEPRTLEL
ncbi:MAG: O-antigen ligase family protein, partial [Candidatus Binatia bacterium]